MKCQVLDKNIDINSPPRFEWLYTLDDLEELIDGLGGSIQMARSLGGFANWTIDNFNGKPK